MLGQCLPSGESGIEMVARQQERSTAGLELTVLLHLLKLLSTCVIFLGAWKLHRASLTSPCSESAGGVWEMKTCWPRSTISKDPTARWSTVPSSEVWALQSHLLFSQKTKVSLGLVTGVFQPEQPRGRGEPTLLTYPAPQYTGAARAHRCRCACLPTSPQTPGDTAAGRPPSWRTVLWQIAPCSQTWLLLLLAHILQRTHQKTVSDRGVR